jgi:hypothetical protein
VFHNRTSSSNVFLTLPLPAFMASSVDKVYPAQIHISLEVSVMIPALIQAYCSKRLALRTWRGNGVNYSGLFGISILPKSQSMVGLTFFNHGSLSMMFSGSRSVTRKLVGSFQKPIMSVRHVK